MIPLATLMVFFSRLTSGDYVDIACAGLILLCVGIGLTRGISGELSRLLSLALGATAGYWIYIPGVQTMAGLEYLKKNPQFASLIAFCVALLGGLACFLLLNYILGHIIKIVIATFLDRSLGLIAGLLNAVILLALAFTLASILPDKAQRDVFCRQSRAGRYITPHLERFLHTPATAVDPEEDEEKKPNAAAPAKSPTPATAVTVRPTTRPVSQPATKTALKPTSGSTAKVSLKPVSLKRTHPITKTLTSTARPTTNGLAQTTARSAMH